MNNKFFKYAEIFVAVVQCNSITSAAESLKTSKSNVSQKLSDFETWLDLKLLSRTTRQMELTPAGKRVYQICRQSVEATTKAASEIGLKYVSGTQPNGRVTVSGSNIYLTSLLLPRLQLFLEQYPDVNPIFIGSDRKVDFAAEDVDIGIRIGPVLPGNYMATPIRPLKRILCASKDYFSTHDVPAHPRDLAHQSCILREQETPTWQFQNENEIYEHHIRAPKITVNTIELAHAAVKGGLGHCVLATFVVERDIAHQRICRILPDWEILPIPVTLLCKPSRLMRPQVSALHKFLVTEFGA